MRVNRFNFGYFGALYFVNLKGGNVRALDSALKASGVDGSIIEDVKNSRDKFIINDAWVISYNSFLSRIEFFDFEGVFQDDCFEINDIYTLSQEDARVIEQLSGEESLTQNLIEVSNIGVPVLTSFFAVKHLLQHDIGEFKEPRALLIACDNLRRVNLQVFSKCLLSKFIMDDRVANFSGYPRLFDLYCDSFKYDCSILKTCYTIINKVGGQYYIYSNLGTVYFNLGELELSDYYYSLAKSSIVESDVDVNEVTPFNKGFLSWDSLSSWSEDYKAGVSSDCQFFPVTVNNVSCVHMVSADSRYYGLYGRQLIKSSIEKSFDGFVVHVNIVNPSDEILGDFKNFQKQYPSIFSYSFEWLSEGLSSKAYYASSRYIHLTKIMELYQSPVFVTDIDMRVNAAWEETLKKYEDNDVCLHSATDAVDFKNYLSINGRPWAIPAGYVFVNNSEAGKKFSQSVAEYILSHYYEEDENHTNWVIDQVAIRRALDRLIDNGDGFSIGRLLTNFMSAPRKSFQTKSSWASSV